MEFVYIKRRIKAFGGDFAVRPKKIAFVNFRAVFGDIKTFSGKGVGLADSFAALSRNFEEVRRFFGNTFGGQGKKAVPVWLTGKRFFGDNYVYSGAVWFVTAKVCGISRAVCAEMFVKIKGISAENFGDVFFGHCCSPDFFFHIIHHFIGIFNMAERKVCAFKYGKVVNCGRENPAPTIIRLHSAKFNSQHS